MWQNISNENIKRYHNYPPKTIIFVDIGFQSNTHLIYAETEI